MYSWLLSVYFYFPLLVSCLKFWCCFAKEGIIKVPYKLFPINSFQGQARKRGEKRKKLMWKRCLCLLLCAIYPLTCMEGLAGFKTLEFPFLACLLWEGNGNGMLCLNCSAVTDFKLLWRFQVVKAFTPSSVCCAVSWDCPAWIAVGEPIACQWSWIILSCLLL